MVQMIATKGEFDEKVKGADAGVIVAVDFTATWCGPCRTIGPEFEKLADEYSNILCFKVDVDENEETAGSEGVTAMPTFKFYQGGKKIDEMVGANVGSLKALFAKHSPNSQRKS